MMEQSIQGFPKQFSYDPVIKNAERLKRARKFVIVGMGGSALVGGILKMRGKDANIIVHKGYGFPALDDAFLKDSLVIACSYSGNTEETVDAFRTALAKGMDCAAIATGGEVLALAKEHGAPYIELPSVGIQPRVALGYVTMAHLKMMGYEQDLAEARKLAVSLNQEEAETRGKALAEKLRGNIPVVYASSENRHLAYDWKIKLNETGKIPAFFNIFPELNHNEMTGFDASDSTKELSSRFHFVFLKDANDHPRIQKRMEVCKQLYEERGLPVEVVEYGSGDGWYDIFSLLLVADWTAYHLALFYGVESNEVPMVEEFKKLMK